MRVLIYGATGYLGGAIVRRLVGEHDVVGFARRADAADDLRTLGADAVVGDLDDISAAVAHVDAADAVIYAAQLLIQPEFDVVEAVIERMAGSGKTLVFTSGTGVLSERTDGDWSENTFAEDDEFVPSKYVGARKRHRRPRPSGCGAGCACDGRPAGHDLGGTVVVR
ncbi:NAD(P)H-binding protein [Gordonia humi]|uniref:NAD(P)H-binding protein n=1 Tax=Gordonia humi TaxID=686429 RepID=UPI003618EB16